jgi:hypothetical protein
MKRAPILALLLVASAASAHHGSSSQFDQSKTLEVSGVVVKIRFVNPHSYVYFDVTTDSGEVQNWRCEMRAATTLKRSGWSADMFPEGTRIHVNGVPAWREPHGCYINEFSLDDGDAIARSEQLEGAEVEVDTEDRPPVLANGQPNISGDWAVPLHGPGGPGGNRPPPGGPGGPDGGRPPRPRGGQYSQSEAGLAAAADFDREDNPRFNCKPVSIFHDWTFDQHINRIEQSDDSITLTYGFMDIVRTIHLDKAVHPADIAPSRAGHSIGNWDGNTLTVDTVGFAEGYLDGLRGVKHSDQMHTVEKFILNPDEASLTRTYEGEDSLYLTKAFTGEDKLLLSGTPFDPYNCEDLTTEVAEGH